MFRSPLITVLLLDVLVLSACQPKGPTSLPPKNAPVVEAFSKQKGMCEGMMDWSVEASTKDWIDASIEWVAIDTATVQDNLKHIKFETSVDGTTLADTMKYPGSPEPFSINCDGTLIEGTGVRYTLFLPPLTKGEHTIAWRVIIEDDLNDGWSDYPKEAVFTFTGTLTIK